ncbi:MAG: hypothetical protein AAF823_05590 [Planctomycetota bacterium]
MASESNQGVAASAVAPRGWRCEGCGYPIGGMALDAGCPECGQRVGDADPRRRDGPAWAKQRSASAWLATLIALTTRPRATYRALDFTGSATPARLFLLSCVVLCWINPATLHGLRIGDPRWVAGGIFASKALLALTYLDVLAVSCLMRVRGWSLGPGRVERVAAYAAPGWVVGMGLLTAAWLAGQPVTPMTLGLGVSWAGLARSSAWVGPAALAVGLGVLLLPFEGLMYLGLRQCRFANRAESDV